MLFDELKLKYLTFYGVIAVYFFHRLNILYIKLPIVTGSIIISYVIFYFFNFMALGLA